MFTDEILWLLWSIRRLFEESHDKNWSSLSQILYDLPFRTPCSRLLLLLWLYKVAKILPMWSLTFIFMLSVFLYISPSVCLSICPSIHLSICLSILLFVCPSVCLSFSLSVYFTVCLFFCLSVCSSVQFVLVLGLLSVCPSVHLFILLYVCPSIIGLSFYLSVCPSVWHHGEFYWRESYEPNSQWCCLSLSFWLSVLLSIYQSVFYSKMQEPTLWPTLTNTKSWKMCPPTCWFMLNRECFIN